MTLKKITGDGLKITIFNITGREEYSMLRDPSKCGETLPQQAKAFAKRNPMAARIYDRKGTIIYEAKRRTYRPTTHRPTVPAPAALEGAAAADPIPEETTCDPLDTKIIQAQAHLESLLIQRTMKRRT